MCVSTGTVGSSLKQKIDEQKIVRMKIRITEDVCYLSPIQNNSRKHFISIVMLRIIINKYLID